MGRRDAYSATRRARATVRPVTVTFAFGLGLSGRMDLSVAQIESMRAGGEITADVRCERCGEHAVDCPEIGPYLVEWPAGWSWRDDATTDV